MEKLVDSIKRLNLKDKDILLIKLTENYFSRENAQTLMESVQSALKFIDIENNKKIGILMVKEPADVILLDEDALLGLGLIKINNLFKNLNEKEFKDLMNKIGFEEIVYLEKVTEEDFEKIYIVHTTKDYDLATIAKLYGVNPKECINSEEPIQNPDTFYHLYPRLDNKYELPIKKGR